MKFYQDQLVTGGASNNPLPTAHRLIYVRHGAVIANGRRMEADSTGYFNEPVNFEAAAQWSQVWRWDLAWPNADPALLAGNGVLSTLRMARVITTLEMAEESQWLFRLDRITSAAGRVTPRHQHHGPGIRCLYQGTFNVQDASEVVQDRIPGDPWWESGVDTVVAWHSRQLPAIFIRALVLPVELQGAMSNIWKSDGPPPQANWHLFIDEVITL
ncbi:MAG: hypothetical protein O7G32_15570 [SAR324 cluster bacterium]|nr:hypothetical protein [SAR324 cluster bacterium]